MHNSMGTGECLVLAQSDRLANAPQSGHPDAGRIYHVIVRFSLEPDRHFLGLGGRIAKFRLGLLRASAVQFKTAQIIVNKSAKLELFS
jgi:hypothetical protein